MTKAPHTPGPWVIEPHGPHPRTHALYSVRIENRHGLRLMNLDDGDANFAANARLIAAAPDMYEALTKLIESGLLDTLLDMDKAMADDGDDPIAAPHAERIRAAIAKATGENSDITMGR